MNKYEKLDTHVFVTKLAGFEHSKYIQYNETRKKINNNDIPLVQGKNIRNGRFVENYDWYIEKKISDNLIRSKLNKRCILIPYVGSNLGEVGIFEHPYDCHMASNIAKVELIDDCYDLDYLKYYFQSDIGQAYLFQSKQGSAQPNITMEAIRNTMVIYRDKIVQNKIVKVLKKIDRKIDNNIQINNNLEELMKTIYQRWFIEFEFPNDDGKPYKSSGGRLVYNEELKQNIPEEWEVKVLNDISNFVSGFAFSSNDYTKNGKYKLYTIKNVQDGNIVSIVDNTLNELPVNMPNECLLKPKDLIMSLTGNVGRVGLVYENNVLLNQRVLKIEPQNNLCYLYSLYRNDFMKSRCEKISSGTSQKNLSPIELGKQKVLYSKKIVGKFEETNRSLIDTYVNNLIENQKLIALKEFLLPMLMNGQINVDDIEI